MEVFSGRFSNFDVLFALLALSLCVLGRLLNIFPLSWIANLCRQGEKRINVRMQFVLWFAGLRGAIAFALAINMPGNHREIYATTTLFICIFTTVVCGGLTDRMLTRFGMKQTVGGRSERGDSPDSGNGVGAHPTTSSPTSTSRNRPNYSLTHSTSFRVYHGAKRLFKDIDHRFLRHYFGGPTAVASALDHDHRQYELGYQQSDSDDEEDMHDLDLTDHSNEKSNKKRRGSIEPMEIDRTRSLDS